jgi:hypothetical protein
MQEKGEIQKRLEQNLCPWCMSALRLLAEEYKGTQRIITRQCTQCRGTVQDTFEHEKGKPHGDDTRSQS